MSIQRTEERVLGLIWSRLEANFLITQRAGDDLRELESEALSGLLRVLRGCAWKRGLAPNWEAVNWLAQIGADAVPGAHRSLVENDDPGTRWAAGEALAYIAKPAVPALIEALHHADAEIRLIATYALTSCRDPRALPTLIEALNDNDPQVSLSAAKAIKHLGSTDAIPHLHTVLAENRCASPHAVRWALLQLQSLETVE